MSVHTGNSIEVARKRGGWAGDPAARDLWKLTKRELVELALRMVRSDDVKQAVHAVTDELDTLRANGIV